MSAARIPPLRDGDWDGAVEQVLAPWRIPAGDGSPSRVPNIFATLARNPQLLAAWEPFAAEILLRGALPARDRELLVMRTAWNCRCSYIWSSHHSGHGPEAGLSEEEMARIPQGPAAAGWSDWDATLLRAADELHGAATIANDTWEPLAARYGESELIELAMLVGEYHLMAYALNSLAVPDEAGAVGLPAEPPPDTAVQ